MKTYKAKSFTDRAVLEDKIILELGKTTEKKNASIVGKVVELKKLFLSHGQSVWGVEVKATDFKVEKKSHTRINRGVIHKSKIF